MGEYKQITDIPTPKFIRTSPVLASTGGHGGGDSWGRGVELFGSLEELAEADQEHFQSKNLYQPYEGIQFYRVIPVDPVEFPKRLAHAKVMLTEQGKRDELRRKQEQIERLQKQIEQLRNPPKSFGYPSGGGTPIEEDEVRMQGRIHG
jgi:hypothetical protein